MTQSYNLPIDILLSPPRPVSALGNLGLVNIRHIHEFAGKSPSECDTIMTLASSFPVWRAHYYASDHLDPYVRVEDAVLRSGGINNDYSGERQHLLNAISNVDFILSIDINGRPIILRIYDGQVHLGSWHKSVMQEMLTVTDLKDNTWTGVEVRGDG
ncbi:MAG: hypothetical protein Q9164_006552 [Protoblastenia rupestris]